MAVDQSSFAALVKSQIAVPVVFFCAKCHRCEEPQKTRVANHGLKIWNCPVFDNEMMRPVLNQSGTGFVSYF